MTRVWIDDNHPIFRRGIASCLADAGFDLVGESARFDPLPDPKAIDVLVFEADETNLMCASQTVNGSGVRLVALVRQPSEQLLMDAIDLGVASILMRQDLVPTALLGSLRAAAGGNTTIPTGMLPRLLARAAHSPRSGGGAAITKRELNVLRLLASGADTRGIADELCYSDRTVKNIVHDVLMKLYCRNRAHAVALATRQGLI